MRLIWCGNVKATRDWRAEYEVVDRWVRKDVVEVKRLIVACEDLDALWIVVVRYLDLSWMMKS